MGVLFYIEKVCHWQSLVSLHPQIGSVLFESTLQMENLIYCSVFIMPYESNPSSFTDYTYNTLGEIHRLIDAHSYSGIFLVGDFNVDWSTSEVAV